MEEKEGHMELIRKKVYSKRTRKEVEEGEERLFGGVVEVGPSNSNTHTRSTQPHCFNSQTHFWLLLSPDDSPFCVFL